MIKKKKKHYKKYFITQVWKMCACTYTCSFMCCTKYLRLGRNYEWDITWVL